MPLYIRTTSGLQFPGAVTSLLLKHFYPLSLLLRFHWHCPILRHTTFLWGRSNRYNYSFPFATPFYPTSYLKGKETCALEVIDVQELMRGNPWPSGFQPIKPEPVRTTIPLPPFRGHIVWESPNFQFSFQAHYHRGDTCPDRSSRKWWLFARHFFTSGLETSRPEDSACSGRPHPGVTLAWRTAPAHP